MKAIATADLHLDINNRFEDTKSVLRQMVTYAIENEVEEFWILGDIYDKKRPYNSERVLFHKFVKSLADNDIKVIIISGNHDVDKYQVSALDEFGVLNLDNVELLPNPSLIEFDFHSVYLGHFLVVGAKLGALDYSSTTEVDLKKVLETPADLYLLGDVHKAQRLHSNPDVLYVGSPERIDFGERDELKGFTLVEVDDIGMHCSFIPLETRPMIQFDLTAKECEGICFTETERAIVKIKITCTKEEYKNIDEKRIKEQLPDSNSVRIEYNIIREDRTRNADISESVNPADAFLNYAKEKELDEQTINAGLEIINAS